MSKVKRAHIEGPSHFSLVIPIHKYFHNDVAIWKEATEDQLKPCKWRQRMV